MTLAAAVALARAAMVFLTIAVDFRLFIDLAREMRERRVRPQAAPSAAST